MSAELHKSISSISGNTHRTEQTELMSVKERGAVQGDVRLVLMGRGSVWKHRNDGGNSDTAMCVYLMPLTRTLTNG